jgi:hypothetical protein
MGKIIMQTPGLVVEHRPDGILIYRIRNVRRETADALYVAMTERDQDAYQSGRHVRSILDLRGAGWPTPYGAGKLIQSAEETPVGLRESVAVIVSDSIAMQLISLLLHRLPSRTQKVTRLFSTEEEAIEWLTQRLEQIGA